ncbi:MAG: M48 family metallopeptidase [Burkholderiaceae bacterium]
MTTPAVFFGRYFDGRISTPVPVAMRFDADILVVVAPEFERRAARDHYRLPERIEHGQPIIHLRGGGQVEADDAGALWRAARDAGLRENPASLMSQRWSLALLALVLTIVSLYAGYRWVLPWAASLAAPLVPAVIERSLGREAVAWLDDGLAESSRLPEARQEEIRSRFASMLGRAGEEPVPDALLFRSGTAIGANAFALPGGFIVVTDEIVLAADEIESAVADEALLGVLAHEYGHMSGHHLTRRLLKVSVLAVAASAIWGDIGTLAAVVPTVLGGLDYTRELERDADREAARILGAAGLSVEPLIALFELLGDEEIGEAVSDDQADWRRYLRTHPMTGERIELLRKNGVRLD